MSSILTERYTKVVVIGAYHGKSFVRREWAKYRSYPTQLKVKSETPSTTHEWILPESSMYPGKETSPKSQWTSNARRFAVDQGVTDYTKKPLGQVTRVYKGQYVEWIARCPKCGRRGARYAHLPEETARRGGAKATLSVTHRMVLHDANGVRYHHVSDHCSTLITEENAEDLLNVRELRAWRGWAAE